jgi:hypothetical protein
LVSVIQNPSFERNNGSLDGWDVYVKPTISPASTLNIDNTTFYQDQYGGQNISAGHSLKINVRPGELVEVFNIIPGVCPGATTSSSIQVLSPVAPSCDVYFGMMPASDNYNYYPLLQTPALLAQWDALGAAAPTKWLNLTSQDNLYANTTSGALTFVVDCQNYLSGLIPPTGVTYWIDYAFFFS